MQPLHGVVVKEHRFAVAQHMQRQQHTPAQFMGAQLLGQVLPRQQTGHIDGVTEKVVVDADDLSL